MRAYDELLDFLGADYTPEEILEYTLSEATVDRVWKLLKKPSRTFKDDAELQAYLDAVLFAWMRKVQAAQQVA